ncbi:hypothetical protein [Paenibacillus abyssi]|uniref:Copper amine oxidase-like N-terminal domain-containing protein n=1 Tax=Paenibacillus abyssi TaxID=1340531 RepID=A0A917D2S7_9BACL|nr:hypothetical protein [Paenibacillus abyssi]GGG08138.1 hypothetical protein GCM10010916_26300 [Paenibacillus abyssi]
MKKYARILLFTVMTVSAAFAAGGENSASASPAASAQVQAVPAASEVFINGQEVKFDAYNINGNNYFKLRDLAKALDGTGKSFAVDWDSAGNRINLLPGQAYKPVGGELAVLERLDKKKATVAASGILVNGRQVALTAYNIGGNNYFKLRDLSRQLDFPVTWRSYDNTIQIITYPNVSVTAVNAVAQARTSADYYYSNWFRPSERYLFRTGDRINLLEIKDQTIYIQQFAADFSKLEETTVRMELPLFGGFHMDDDGNYYIVYGQENMEESDDKTVYRVVKYDASWTNTGQADITGVYVSRPFDGSNLTMDSSGGKLVIHSARLRYVTPDDGLRHQSNISFLIDTGSMAVLQKGGQWPDNHVSHSFATYVRFDGDRIVYADHGDAYPRGFVLQVEEYGSITKTIDLALFPGNTGDNYTGAYLGGLESSASNYLVAGSNSVFTYPAYRSSQNVFLSVVPKTAHNIMDVKTVMLTDHPANSDIRIRETHLSRVNENKFVLLWREYHENTSDQALYYAVVDGQGEILQKPVKLAGVPSPGNMTPLVQGNTLTWYFSVSDTRGRSNRQNVIEFYTLKVD